MTERDRQETLQWVVRESKELAKPGPVLHVNNAIKTLAKLVHDLAKCQIHESETAETASAGDGATE